MSETPKVAVSVAEMARMCGLGRSRFYQLIGTTFPFPVYDVSTRRPFYDQEMQKVCLEVRRRNCGIDGKPILFNTKPAPSPKKKTSKVVPVDNADLIAGIKALGIVVTPAQVNAAVSTLYPKGANGVDSASILRSVFIHLKSKEK